MPVKKNNDTLTWDPSGPEKAQAVFSFPVWRQVDDYLGDARRSSFRPVVLLAVLVTSRAFRSQKAALKHLRGPGVWAELSARLESVVGPLLIPSVPPTAKVLDDFVEWLVETFEGGLVSGLSELFTTTQAGLARMLGQFPDDVWPNFADPDPRSTIFGDGTYLKPYSDVTKNVHVAADGSSEVTYEGSRAVKGRPRLQEKFTDGSEDGKTDVRGVNHITIATWTRYGTVALAVEQAYGAEITSARVALDRVFASLGGLVHTVVWDGAIVGIDIERLFTENGTLVVNKNRIRLESSYPHLLQLPASRAVADYEAGLPLPLGTSVYPRSRPGDYDILNTVVAHYGQPDGVDCQHDLWVDDGGLWDVVAHGPLGHQYKIARAVALSANRTMGTDGAWHLEIVWHLPCAICPEGHTFITLTKPRAERAKPGGAERKRAERLLRPVARVDLGSFRATFGLRNITESINSWFKGLFVHGNEGRAMRLDVRAQAIDHLCAMLLLNAITYERYRRQQG